MLDEVPLYGVGNFLAANNLYTDVGRKLVMRIPYATFALASRVSNRKSMNSDCLLYTSDAADE